MEAGTFYIKYDGLSDLKLRCECIVWFQGFKCLPIDDSMFISLISLNFHTYKNITEVCPKHMA